jgi:crossover junction endodeoxyribonuclease RusA
MIRHVPLHIVSCANVREHWATRAKRSKAQRQAAALVVRSAIRYERWVPGARIRVRLTRIGKRRLDSDNLAGGFKAVRDGVADAVGIDDGSARYEWEYAQETGKEYAVRIEVS